jgi:hypothetical protein
MKNAFNPFLDHKYDGFLISKKESDEKSPKPELTWGWA